MTASSPTEQALASYRGVLLTYAYRISGDVHEAEDIVHAALLKALQDIRNGVQVENLRAWLYRITHNEALTTRRRSRLREQTLRELPSTSDGAPAASLEKLDARAKREVGSLAEPYRSSLRLRYFQHLQIHEVAEVLELPVGTVKSHIARGLRLLAGRMADALEEARP